MKKALQKIQAFTLIELIVVIAIIAILATSGTLMLTKRFSGARDSSRKQAVSQISTALDVSMTSRTSFPIPENSTEVYDVSGALVWYQGVFGPSVADIITAIDSAPQDPSTNEYYGYSISSDKKKYQLKAELENEDTIAYISRAYAADDENKIAYVDGNYNGYILTYTGGKYYLYKLPSIFMKNTGLQAGSKVGSGNLPLVNPGKKISNDVQVKVVDITAVVEDKDSDGSVASGAAAKLGIEVNLISKVLNSAAGSEGVSASTSSGGTTTNPVDGICGTSDGGSFQTAPSENLCDAGSSSFIDSEGNDGAYNRICAGSDGGADASCTATKEALPQVNYGQPDAYTVFLLKSDTTNGSTTFADSSDSSHTIQRQGNAKHSTSRSKIGGSSVYLDGNSSYLLMSDSADWDFGTQDFTIDFWINREGLQGISNGRSYNDIVFALRHGSISNSSNTLTLAFDGSSGNIYKLFYNYAALGDFDWIQPTYNQWYHIAIVRDSGILKMFVNGTLIDSIEWTKDFTSTEVFSIGTNTKYTDTFRYLQGYIDQFRVSKGIARWTSNFTPPTHEYGGTTCASTTFTSCAEIKSSGCDEGNGDYQIYDTNTSSTITVTCDMDSI